MGEHSAVHIEYILQQRAKGFTPDEIIAHSNSSRFGANGWIVINNRWDMSPRFIREIYKDHQFYENIINNCTGQYKRVELSAEWQAFIDKHGA